MDWDWGFSLLFNESALEGVPFEGVGQEGDVLKNMPTNYTPMMLDNDTSIIHDDFQMLDWVYPCMITIYACIFLVGVTGNFLVILVIAKDRRMRNTANFYLISLSVADLMIIVCCLPVAAYELHTEEVWNLGPVLCRLAPFLQYLSTNASIGTMVAISIERYIVICRPFKVRAYCTRTRASGVIIILWAFSFICAAPLFKFTQHATAEHYKLGINVTVCYIDHVSNELYFFSHQAFFYVLPGLLLSLLYTIIIWNLRKFKCENFGHSPDSRRNRGPGAKSHAEASQQLIVMLSTVVVCYFLCLLPYNSVTFLSLVSNDLLTKLDVTAYNVLLCVSRIMFFFNSCSNPILYNAISGKFRQAFIRLFRVGRYRSSGRDSRTMSVRSADYDYDHPGKFDEFRSGQTRSGTSGRKAEKDGTKRSYDINRNGGRFEHREMCHLRKGQRIAIDGPIRQSVIDRHIDRSVEMNSVVHVNIGMKDETDEKISCVDTDRQASFAVKVPLL